MRNWGPQYKSAFARIDSIHGVLHDLALAEWTDPTEAANQAGLRLEELRAADNAKMQPGLAPKVPEAQAAIIELVENHDLGADHQGVMKPSELRINGVPILVPREDPIEIEGLETPGDMDGGLIVRVRMFARRVVIGEAL